MSVRESIETPTSSFLPIHLSRAPILHVLYPAHHGHSKLFVPFNFSIGLSVAANRACYNNASVIKVEIPEALEVWTVEPSWLIINTLVNLLSPNIPFVETSIPQTIIITLRSILISVLLYNTIMASIGSRPVF